MNEKPIIGITTGDLNGIGLEVIIKTLENALSKPKELAPEKL